MVYFSAQPELIQELVELVRAQTDPALRGHVPLDVCILAIHCLAALVHARTGGSGMGLVARNTNVFQELGIMRGQYSGLLPSLVRHSVAALHGMPAMLDLDGEEGGGSGSGGGGMGSSNIADHRRSEESKARDPGERPTSQQPPPDADLSLGMAFVEAATSAAETALGSGVTSVEGRGPGWERREGDIGRGSSFVSGHLDQLRWVESVFSLVWAVVSVQSGAAAMTDCGLIPALLNVVLLNMNGEQGFSGVRQPFQRRYVISQAVQIMETAVMNNTSALNAFRDLNAAEVM
ncbi:unnamed protein product, partial [Choristocarpus tenellus]